MGKEQTLAHHSINFKKLCQNLGANDSGFLQRVYVDGLSKYQVRLAQIGFDRLETVLDAGCGFGQWTFALAKSAKSVYGIDISASRIQVYQTLSNELGVDNIQFQVARLEDIPFADSALNGIFCYSVIYLTDYRKTITEFFRLLKLGGLLYICTNGAGRYLYEIIHNPHSTTDFNMRKYAFKTFRNNMLNRWQNFSPENGARIVTPKETRKILEKNGFEVIAVGPEASVANARVARAANGFHASSYFGLVNVFEILARKP